MKTCHFLSVNERWSRELSAHNFFKILKRHVNNMIRSNNVDYKNIYGKGKHLEFLSKIEEENKNFGRLLKITEFANNSYRAGISEHDTL